MHCPRLLYVVLVPLVPELSVFLIFPLLCVLQDGTTECLFYIVKLENWIKRKSNVEIIE